MKVIIVGGVAGGAACLRAVSAPTTGNTVLVLAPYTPWRLRFVPTREGPEVRGRWERLGPKDWNCLAWCAPGEVGVHG